MDGKFYNENDGGASDAARLRLCLFDEDSVREIINLVNRRGTGLIDDIFNKTTEADPPHVLGIMGRQYMKPHDVPGVLLGLSTVILSGLRKPKMGPDEYADILAGAYGIPELMARHYANQIESYDAILADANRDGDTTFMERLQQYTLTLEEGARRVVNGLSNALGLGTLINWDQTQAYDIDHLDELHSLGEIVAKLNRRGRLIQAQSLLAAQMNLFQTGDIEEDGDPIGELVGDVMSAAGSRNLPVALQGNFRDSMLAARKSTLGLGTDLFRHAGLTTKGGKVSAKPTTAVGKKVAKSIASILKKNPTVAVISGALGVGKSKKKAVKKSKGDPEEGNLAGDIASLYGDIAADYGDSAAAAWLAGDIDSLAKAVEVSEIGDSQEDMNDAYIGEVDFSSAEQGGLFRKRRKKKKKPLTAASVANKEAAAMEKTLEQQAELSRRAAALRSKIALKNRMDAIKYQAANPSAAFAGINPGEGLSDDMLGSYLSQGMSIPDESLSEYDQALLNQIPDLDGGAVFDQVNMV